uniref:Uncharacterized protein n=1 Tax=Musa acuminata subsp. malaccensis TaxID=214687 RepID=A0A804K596_MUSAM
MEGEDALRHHLAKEKSTLDLNHDY